MADITKCGGHKCPVASKCYRFTAKSSSWQSYFSKPPFTITKKKFNCDMFWGEASEMLMAQLKSIVGK